MRNLKEIYGHLWEIYEIVWEIYDNLRENYGRSMDTSEFSPPKKGGCPIEHFDFPRLGSSIRGDNVGP